jgi:hypothetical protein
MQKNLRNIWLSIDLVLWSRYHACVEIYNVEKVEENNMTNYLPKHNHSPDGMVLGVRPTHS